MTETATRQGAQGAADAETHRLFIAGEWVDGDVRTDLREPQPGRPARLIGRFAGRRPGRRGDGRSGRPRSALPRWKATPAPKRGEILYAFGALMARAQGAPGPGYHRGDGQGPARGPRRRPGGHRHRLPDGRRGPADVRRDRRRRSCRTSGRCRIRQPLGVAGIITPWNFPMAIPCWKMMPALVAGNAVVFKPACDTPHCAALLVELMAEAGFPPGTVNLVTGSGADVGDADRRFNPDVPVISFTGHSSTGQADRRSAPAGGSSASSLELGGKNADRRDGRRRPRPRDRRDRLVARSARPASAARPPARVIVEEAVVDSSSRSWRRVPGSFASAMAWTRRPTSGP